MALKNPPQYQRFDPPSVIEPLGLTVTEAAKVLGVGRQALSSLFEREDGAHDPDGLAGRESLWTSRMEHLMRMQLAFDLAQARKADRGFAR